MTNRKVFRNLEDFMENVTRKNYSNISLYEVLEVSKVFKDEELSSITEKRTPFIKVGEDYVILTKAFIDIKREVKEIGNLKATDLEKIFNMKLLEMRAIQRGDASLEEIENHYAKYESILATVKIMKVMKEEK